MTSGLPSFAVVGLPDAAVRESRERVRAAIQNSGFDFPQSRITASLAPADLRKAGPGFDLAIAAALLGANGELRGERAAPERRSQRSWRSTARSGPFPAPWRWRSAPRSRGSSGSSLRRRARMRPGCRPRSARREAPGWCRSSGWPISGGSGPRRARVHGPRPGSGCGPRRAPGPGRSPRPAGPSRRPRDRRGRGPRDAHPRPARRRQEPRRPPPALDHAAAIPARGDGDPADRKRLRKAARDRRGEKAVPGAAPHDLARRARRRRQPAARRRGDDGPRGRALPRRARRVLALRARGAAPAARGRLGHDRARPPFGQPSQPVPA